ncbi:MAG TPA: hypothetical protein VN611_13235 [Patescibacteria group bacterium]|nr:hypothetical protein [Patescibacteria group bacterium]
MRKKSIVSVALLLLAFCGGYWFQEKEDSPGRVVFNRTGVEIIFDDPREVNQVTIRDEQGDVLIVAVAGPGERYKTDVFFKWNPGRRYLVELKDGDDSKIMLEAFSPAAAREKTTLTLQAPYGMNQPGSEGIVPLDGVFTANLLVVNQSEGAVNARLNILIPAGLELAMTPNGLHCEERHGVVYVTGERRLSTRHEIWSEQLQLKTRSQTGKMVMEAEGSFSDGTDSWRLQESVALKVASTAEISANIRIQSVELPVDAAGRFDPKACSGALVYNPPSRITQLLGAQTEHNRLDEEPFAYSIVTLRNDGDQQALVLVSGKIKDAATGGLAAAFMSPPHKNAGFGYSYAVASLAPHTNSQVVLPVYLNENAVLAGNYRLLAEASVFGTRQVISTQEKSVFLSARNDRPVIITALMTLAAVGGIGWLLWRREGVLERFSTKEMVIVSLFGTATFVTVNLPSTILWDIAHVVLGPFSFFLTGFFNQTVLFTLLISLAVLVPRPGAVALMVAVRMILNGFIFGHFTPVQILSYTMLALFLEAGLYITGISRGRQGGLSGVTGLAVVCGLVDVATTYMNFMAYMTLYRLFYADWYIGAVATAGFFYTAAGAVAGRRLGDSLKRTVMD